MSQPVYPAPWYAPPPPPPLPPGTLIAAAVVVWLCAAGTAAVTGLWTLLGLFVGIPMADAFDAPTLWWLGLLAGAAAVIGLCALVSYLAYRALRRGNVARWLLAACSALTFVVGLLAMISFWPFALVALGALAVLTILLLPSTANWTRPEASQH